MEFSLRVQIEEVEYEIGMRHKVYPGLVYKGKLRQSIADMHVARMMAVLETLRKLLAETGE